jgi:UDP-3-O-[3-hydroxymyristoyl] glucosamine N-acyltransferase
MKSYNIEELSQLLDGQLIGNRDLIITGPEEMDSAREGSISFIGSSAYLNKWESSKAKAAIIQENLVDSNIPGEDRAFVVVKNADLAMAKILELYSPEPLKFNEEISKSAVVSESAQVGNNTKIGANCFIGDNVQIGADTIIYPNTTVLDNAVIGNGTIIKSGTVISERCVVGNFCIIHSNVSIGTDGFGYRPSDDGRSIVKIPHIGNVEIGDHVEIGSSTCVDRGKFSSTTIGDFTKIDNLCQIGHNTKIGRGCLITGCCGISGSVNMGDGVKMGGNASIKDHINVGNGATIGGKSGVINDVPAGQTVLGFPAIEVKKTLRKWAVMNRLIETGIKKK